MMIHMWMVVAAHGEELLELDRLLRRHRAVRVRLRRQVRMLRQQQPLSLPRLARAVLLSARNASEIISEQTQTSNILLGFMRCVRTVRASIQTSLNLVPMIVTGMAIVTMPSSMISDATNRPLRTPTATSNTHQRARAREHHLLLRL